MTKGSLAGLCAGLVAGMAVPPAAVLIWFAFGNPPVAVADAPLPFEKKVVRVALKARIRREAPKSAPIALDPAALEAGAAIYREHCSGCHGVPGRTSAYATRMFPRAPQLFEKHRDAVGVSDDPVGETYWKVKNGIRLTGMPAYRGLLTETQLWRVSLLLSSADKPFADPVKDILTRPQR